MAKRIRAVFSGGKATIKTTGFHGAACLAATVELEKALGVKTGDTKTTEFREATREADAEQTAQR